MMKPEADTSILRLLDDVTDSPERYRMVAALMHFDMMTWQEKDLGIVTQVVDFGKGLVHTTWTSPERKLASFQGRVKPLD